MSTILAAVTPGAQGTTGAQTGTVSPRLHKAATQFESMMLKDLLKPLSESDGMGGDGKEGGSGPLQGFAVDAIANTMANSGALGFARQIEQTLSHAAAKYSSQQSKKS